MGLQQKRRYVALDRDGTIIVERQYLSSPDQVELLPVQGRVCGPCGHWALAW